MERQSHFGIGITHAYAYDESIRLVHCTEAMIGVDHTCPKCHGTMRVRGGPHTETRMRHHFFHLNPGGDAGCRTRHWARESDRHRLAKRILRDLLIKHIGSTSSLKIQARCSQCAKGIQWQLDLPGFDQVEEEWLHAASNRRHDVCLLLKGELVFGFEVYVSNAVEANRRASFRRPWVEIDGHRLVDRPRPGLRALQWSEGLIPNLCSDCENRKKDAQAGRQAILAIARKRALFVEVTQPPPPRKLGIKRRPPSPPPSRKKGYWYVPSGNLTKLDVRIEKKPEAGVEWRQHFYDCFPYRRNIDTRGLQTRTYLGYRELRRTKNGRWIMEDCPVIVLQRRYVSVEDTPTGETLP